MWAAASLVEDDVNSFFFIIKNIHVHVEIRVEGWNIQNFSLLPVIPDQAWRLQIVLFY